MAEARILVVDDDPEMRGNMADVLGDAGFETAVAGSGEEALDRMAGSDFDLVLLDLLMPGMGGMAALERMANRHPRSRVVMMTAFATIENAVEAMRRGADDYVTKPFRIDAMLATVRRILEQARFAECRFLLDLDGTFNCLANVLRREILRLVASREMRFMDIARALEVDDHTKINFHLKALRGAGLIRPNERKCYELTPEGRRIIDWIDHLARDLTGR